jgi:hypothetical protein
MSADSDNNLIYKYREREREREHGERNMMSIIIMSKKFYQHICNVRLIDAPAIALRTPKLKAQSGRKSTLGSIRKHAVTLT